MTGIDVVSPGVQSSVQDAVGRVGQLRGGFSRSGACDPYALQAANLCVGNDRNAAGVEIPTGRFRAVINTGCVIAVTGPADTSLRLGGVGFAAWEGVSASAGDELEIGAVQGPGFRMYLAVSGGIDVPVIYGSRSTHARAQIGGYHGRALRRGDVLPIGPGSGPGGPGGGPAGPGGSHTAGGARHQRRRVPLVSRPTYDHEWEIELVKGPYADPDYLTTDDWAQLTGSVWTIDLNADRTATPLVGPRMAWARADGGAGGPHPANLVDGPYPAGGLLMYGDLPVVLGPDGPVSGGFVTVATVPRAAMWKVGQLRPGSAKVRFREISAERAAQAAVAHERRLNVDAMEEL